MRAVVVDEAAYIPFKLFTTLICPLLQLVGTALFMISTRTGDPDDPFNEMLFMKYDDISEEDIKKGANPYLFNSLVWDSVCDECRASGVEASHCVHREIERPPWIRKNNRFLRRVMMLDPEAYKTEILGLVEGGQSTPAFDNTAVAKVFTKEKIFRGKITSKYIFIGTDPCGMNTTGKSLYSSIAIAFVDHKPVVSIFYFDAIP